MVSLLCHWIEIVDAADPPPAAAPGAAPRRKVDELFLLEQAWRLSPRSRLNPPPRAAPTAASTPPRRATVCPCSM